MNAAKSLSRDALSYLGTTPLTGISGGGFGRRLSNDCVSQAVQVAKAVPGVPVKLISSREECMRRGYYAPVAAARFKGALDEQGKVSAWYSHVAYGRSPTQPYGMSRIPFALQHVRCEYSTVDTPPPFGWMRDAGRSRSAGGRGVCGGRAARAQSAAVRADTHATCGTQHLNDA